VLLDGGGREAVERFDAQPQGVSVVPDVRLPGMDGALALAALRARHPAVRCCFMGGYIDHEEGQRLLALGAVAVLAKPFHFDTLGETLRGLLKGERV
jgi:DNA-binding NarL/FixJ family response regulator